MAFCSGKFFVLREEKLNWLRNQSIKTEHRVGWIERGEWEKKRRKVLGSILKLLEEMASREGMITKFAMFFESFCVFWRIFHSCVSGLLTKRMQNVWKSCDKSVTFLSSPRPKQFFLLRFLLRQIFARASTASSGKKLDLRSGNTKCKVHDVRRERRKTLFCWCSPLDGFFSPCFFGFLRARVNPKWSYWGWKLKIHMKGFNIDFS